MGRWTVLTFKPAPGSGGRGRGRAFAQVALLVAVMVALALLFPPVLRFAEMAARELRYFWWVILLVLLGAWMVWGLGRKKD